MPCGERVSFWALGEIVKAHAGILESDDTATAAEKLAAMAAKLDALEQTVTAIQKKQDNGIQTASLGR